MLAAHYIAAFARILEYLQRPDDIMRIGYQAFSLVDDELTRP
jgi:hypothetical protein